VCELRKQHCYTIPREASHAKAYDASRVKRCWRYLGASICLLAPERAEATSTLAPPPRVPAAGHDRAMNESLNHHDEGSRSSSFLARVPGSSKYALPRRRQGARCFGTLWRQKTNGSAKVSPATLYPAKRRRPWRATPRAVWCSNVCFRSSHTSTAVGQRGPLVVSTAASVGAFLQLRLTLARGEAQRQAALAARRLCLSCAARPARLTVGPASARTLGPRERACVIAVPRKVGGSLDAPEFGTRRLPTHTR